MTDKQQKRTTTDFVEYIEWKLQKDPELRRRVEEATAELERQAAEWRARNVADERF